MKIVHITTGDLDGIGLEISLKALNTLGPVKGVNFVLWRSNKANKEVLNILNKKFKRINVRNKKDILSCHSSKKINVLWDISSASSPTKWVTYATKYCLQNKNTQALVTGPLSKSQIQKEGFKHKGHTGLLKNLSETKHVFMVFLGQCFNVVLLNDHIPLKKFKWDKKQFNKCMELSWLLKKDILNKNPAKKIAVLGFNPHAGEDGLLGTEEFFIKKELKNRHSKKVDGPLVPDVAFLKENWKKYFMYLCLYHDQGLIPFKMIHGRKSFQFSMGLPFVRTSVSHGTAKDIFGKNKASSQSMVQALKGAINLLKNHQQ